MFSKSPDREVDARAPAKPTPPPAPTPRNSGRVGPTILAPDVVIKGDITTNGDILIDGVVEGDIRAKSLTVGQDASLTGELIAEEIQVKGKVNGAIRGRLVQLASTARVDGSVLHEALNVESGAVFEGNCRHSSDPLSNSVKSDVASNKTEKQPEEGLTVNEMIEKVEKKAAFG